METSPDTSVSSSPNGSKRTPPPPRANGSSNDPIPITLTSEQLAQNLTGRPADHLDTFERFRIHCVREGWTYEEAAKRLHKRDGSVYGKDSVKHAMYGYRELSVSLAPLVESIEEMLRKVSTPKPVGDYYETRLFREIRRYIAKVKNIGRIGFIVGPNGIGKTTAMTHLDEIDENFTWLHMPEGGHLSTFLKAIAKRRALGDRQTLQNLSENMMMEFPRGHNVVIDEADNCFGSKTAALGQRTLTYLRRCWEQGGWSLTLVMDPPGYKKLMTVEKSDPLRKLYSRRCDPLVLPPFYRDDLNLFARVRDLPPSPEIPHRVTFENAAGQPDAYEAIPRKIEESVVSDHKDGLFIWLGILDEAVEMAKEAGKTVSWNWVLKAYALHNASDVAAKKLCGIALEPEGKNK